MVERFRCSAVATRIEGIYDDLVRTVQHAR
jgi:hypothetical protein